MIDLSKIEGPTNVRLRCGGVLTVERIEHRNRPIVCVLDKGLMLHWRTSGRRYHHIETPIDIVAILPKEEPMTCKVTIEPKDGIPKPIGWRDVPLGSVFTFSTPGHLARYVRLRSGAICIRQGAVVPDVVSSAHMDSDCSFAHCRVVEDETYTITNKAD